MKTYLFVVKTNGHGIYNTIVEAEDDGQAFEKCKKQRIRLSCVTDTFAKVVGTPELIRQF